MTPVGIKALVPTCEHIIKPMFVGCPGQLCLPEIYLFNVVIEDLAGDKDHTQISSLSHHQIALFCQILLFIVNHC